MIEDKNTEFKREYVDDIKKVLVAFANADGGVVYIDIADDGSVIGVSDVDAVMLQVSNVIRDAIKPNLTMFCDITGEATVASELSKVKDTKKEITLSPWIYHELSVLSTIKPRNPQRDVLKHGDSTLYESRNEFLVEYDVGKFLSSMINLTDDIILEWSKKNRTINHSLDELYRIVCPK